MVAFFFEMEVLPAPRGNLFVKRMAMHGNHFAPPKAYEQGGNIRVMITRNFYQLNPFCSAGTAQLISLPFATLLPVAFAGFSRVAYQYQHIAALHQLCGQLLNIGCFATLVPQVQV